MVVGIGAIISPRATNPFFNSCSHFVSTVPPIYYINVSKIPECKHLIEAGKKRGLMIMAVVPKPNDGSKGLVEFYPTAEALLEVGMDQVYEPPHGSKFDVVECAVSYYVVGDAICSPRPPMPFPIFHTTNYLTLCNKLLSSSHSHTHKQYRWIHYIGPPKDN